MKYLPLTLMTVILLSACNKQKPTSVSDLRSQPTLPIQEGELISVDLLNQPYPEYSPSSLGWSTFKGGTVKIYDDFIITTTNDGVSRLALHNWYKDLKFKSISGESTPSTRPD